MEGENIIMKSKDPIPGEQMNDGDLEFLIHDPDSSYFYFLFNCADQYFEKNEIFVWEDEGKRRYGQVLEVITEDKEAKPFSKYK